MEAIPLSFPRAFYRWRPHPWHGLDVGQDPPRLVQAYIEITPFDLIKYEIDKATGYLRVDRPQRNSSLPPTLYGFIPKTFCGQAVGELCEGAAGGDGDPIDICVISERPINRSEVILNARVIGGIKLLDEGKADDKIVAVLVNDNFWNKAQELTDLPEIMVDRLRHYFETYKLIPGEPPPSSILSIYGSKHAFEVIRAAIKDYAVEFGG
jgi:inorganic pyrophosphatase